MPALLFLCYCSHTGGDAGPKAYEYLEAIAAKDEAIAAAAAGGSKADIAMASGTITLFIYLCIFNIIYIYIINII